MPKKADTPEPLPPYMLFGGVLYCRSCNGIVTSTPNGLGGFRLACKYRGCF